jgi:two-component system, chemotaxis family, CheB/CheR fusion protein
MPYEKQRAPHGDSQRFPVVAIGASAGGLEAITAILRALPPDIAMAFVLIQHLDPKRHSILPELLAKATEIPVLEAIDKMKIVSNRVYVMPSNVDIAILDGHLGLSPRVNDHGKNLPIDTFMRTLAEVRMSDAIGVVLSGTASDGTAGVQAIRAKGGVNFAQDPQTAKFRGMPQSAIDSGCVDYVLSPEGIARRLTWISAHPDFQRAAPDLHERPKNDDDEAFNSILNLVSISQGADFREYKPSTIRNRTQQRMAALKIDSLAGYFTYLGEHPEEIGNLSHHILIPVTEFFRNPDVFASLAKTVFPAITGENAHGTVRIWVVACSSGEEVYSLAISLLEFLGDRANTMRIQFFGTDINEKGIAKARAGVYSETALKDTSPDRIAKFFTKAPAGYRVNKRVRDLCVFARQDVTKDPPFSNLNLVSCRNVLMYIQPELQGKIISTLHYALNSSGFLLLGMAESAASYSQMFTVADRKSKIYSRNVVNPRHQHMFRLSSPQNRQAAELSALNAPPRSWASRDEAELQHAADRIVLKECGPAGVIVNDALEILQFRGRTSAYLEPAAGRANLNLLNMVREELAIALRTTINSAKNKGAPIKKKNVVLGHNGKRRLIHIWVFPLDEHGAGPGRCYLILFEDAAALTVSDDKKIQRAASNPRDLVQRQLAEQKRDLQAARRLLREHAAAQEALREDYQSANEALLSANEELQSTNEELETSKEELESTNEELSTVNDELNSSNSILQLLSNDLKNLLDNTVIPVVMVDSDLCIRRMTPSAERVFNVLQSDIGRPITNIRPEIDVDLDPLLKTVLRDVVNLEREVCDQHGHWYRLQIRPYKTLDNRINGAVLVVVDIDAIKKYNQELMDRGELTKSIIENVPEPVLVLNSELRVVMANLSFYHTFEVRPEGTLDHFVYSIGNGQWDKPDLRTLLHEVLPHRRTFLNHQVVFNFPGIGWKTFMVSGRFMEQGSEAAPLILLLLVDITQLKKTEAALIEAEKLSIASRLAASIAHEINNPLHVITNLLYLASTGEDLAAAKSYASQALEQTVHVADITRQTLRFYHQSATPSPVDVSRLVDSLLAVYNANLTTGNISVQREYVEVPSILCLEGDLRQVLVNVIANAVDAMATGGILKIRICNSRDWRDRNRRGIRITIADSGIGMDAATRRRIYEPFFTTKMETGTGLGMWVSAQLVERLRGDLRVWSTARPGRSGTVFSLFLPLDRRQRAEVQAPALELAAESA